MANLNQSFPLQKDSCFIFIGAHTYNLKNKEPQNHDHKFSSKVKKKKKNWDIDFKISGIVSAEALMSRSQKEL